MKIIKLVSENVKRISAVAITPAADGSLVTIGGKNGAGKSSVLDSIAYALGGEKLVPSEPIRTGQGEAKIVVDLGDYIVTRRFYREKFTAGTTDGAPMTESWGPTKSVLIVTNKEGAKYPAPQVLLDKLYGKLTFDPLAFSKEKPPQQNEILRRLVNLDFTEQNGQRKTLFDSRAMDKKTLGFAEAKLTTLPKHPTPQGVYDTVETPIDDVTKELERGRDLQRLAEAADRTVNEVVQRGKTLDHEREGHLHNITNLERQLAAAKSALAACENAREVQKAEEVLAVEEFDRAKKAVPDFSVLNDKLHQVDRANKQARENRVYLEQEQHVKSLQAQIAEQTKGIEKIDTDKAAALQAAKFPVEGLGLTDDGVTFEGLPLDQVSSSVQLRVSIAIGLALNPTLKVLLIRNGNLLDDDSVKQVAEQAAGAGAQVWMEFVTSHADGVSVMLEDGHLA